MLLVAEVVPLKQGLKQPIPMVTQTTGMRVAEVVPLKQGLKPLGKERARLTREVAEVVPLKQGLKH